MSRVNCRNCRHYYITFDVSAPYGCRVYGFKTKTLPSLAVYQSSGMHCTLFAPRDDKGNPDRNPENSGGGFYA